MSAVPERIARLSEHQKRELLAQLLQKNAGKRESLPLSFAQERLWFLDQLQPGSPAYNIPAPVRIPGPCNVGAVERALNEIIRRHEALRTTFTTVEGRPVQVIAPTLHLSVPVIDLEQLPEGEREVEAARLAAEEALRSFDLARGPLLVASLLRLGPADHVLLLTMHHIVSDDWSMGVFFRELGALYEAYASGRPSPLPELPIQYADFAQWQREWLQGEVLEAHLSYWRQQLMGAPAVLELPTDRPRPPVQTFAGAQESFVLPKALGEALTALSQREGVTLFMTLLAAFKTLLHRYTGYDDIVVGSPIANRTRAEIEDLIGFFVNTLVLRADLSGNPTFRELLGRVRDVTLEAYAHQDLPFEKLVEELQPERNLSHNPLVQVLFVLLNAPTQNAPTAGASGASGAAEATGPQVGTGTAKFDLILSIMQAPQGLLGAFEYNTDLFEPARIGRMIGHFQTLLYAIAEDPDRRLGDLPLLTNEERQQMLVEWNDTTVDYPQDQCVHQLFEAQVRRTPGAVAVVFEDQRLTYRELNVRANRLAHFLRKRGVGPEVRVGISVERSLEMVVGLLGILKAGGAYVPLDPSYPAERLAFMMQDAEAPVLLTQERLLEALPVTNAEVICLDRDLEVMRHQSSRNPTSGVTPHNLAYVIYTSGSTGRPKGVAMSHRAICNHMDWMRDELVLNESDVILQRTPISFDASVWEFYSPLLSGATLAILNPSAEKDVTEIASAIREQRVTILQVVPSLLQLLMQQDDFLRHSYSLRLVFCGGEPLSLELLERSLTILQGRLYNLYGTTETAIDSTSWLGSSGATCRTAPIGCPIANTQIYLLDRHLQPVPVGIPGELHISGVGLARGYLNRPELTAEKFIPNPFSEDPGARLYGTGDLARYLPDGNIEFLGRIDHQVKIRGFRIELGEIEAVLGQHPAVRESVVVAREDIANDKRLVAYVVPHGGAAVSVSELRAMLRERLPEYMLPAAFVTLEALPLSPNGKVDRRVLPVPDTARPALQETFVAARSPIEEVLVGIWAEVLGLEQVGIHDNFFELGGHSLLATQVVSRVRESLRVELPLRRIFETPTIAELAVAIVETQIEQAGGPEAEQLLMDLEGLSQDEVRQLLDKHP